ncbi:hypothetical protein JKF63_03837 [Porcisia hertigi]|uniref:SET domain-containing protein n=1 Tax=Porcisia hertigi TaxID=2761500 RepID=A0A836LF07_9TRYP|nr:hypothetical protein JKF63_03837 [Porcisia hertigi]
MRRISQASRSSVYRMYNSLGRSSHEHGPIAVPRDSREGSSEAARAFGASSTGSSDAQTSKAHTASGFPEAAAACVRVGHSPDIKFAHPAKCQQTGPHAEKAHSRSQPQRHRRFSYSSFADDVHMGGERGVAGVRHSKASDMPPAVYPGADLPPIPQRSLAEKRAGKFSFVSDPSQRASRIFYGVEVPNNTPKPKLPMWASSLTSPALGKVRMVEDSWISQDSRGTLGEDVTAHFVRWIRERVSPANSVLREQLETNVLLDLRLATARGVYAKRAFRPGDLVLTIPLSLASSSTDPPSHAGWLTLNSETLAKYSTAAQKRVGIPSYETVKRILSVQRSSFDPIPHPMFLDQVCAALRLACEKADGEASPLYPYLRLLGSAELFDDAVIEELHRGVLDPMTHMEYGDHVKRFRHYMRELHASWWAAYASMAGQGLGTEVSGAAPENTDTPITLDSSVSLISLNGKRRDTPVAANTEGRRHGDASNTTVSFAKENVRDVAASATLMAWKPPPSLEDMEWALRIVLSRQKVLPCLRVHRAAFEHLHEESVEGDELDTFAKAVMRGKYAFYRYVLRAVDEDRLHVNEVDATAIPTVVPLLDMISHPPGGVPNLSYSVERVQGPGGGAGSTLERDSFPCRGDVTDETSAGASAFYQVVVRASEDIEEGEELTVSYVKCYSVAYTLYRYGLLPLSRRDDDVTFLLRANRVDGSVRPAPKNGPSLFSSSKAGVMSAVRRWWASVLLS